MALTPEHAARVLDLDDTATVDDVTKARRQMAKLFHPDHCADIDAATRHMARVNAAADTLIAHLTKKATAHRPVKQPFYRDFSKATRAQKPANEPKQAEQKATDDVREPADTVAVKPDAVSGKVLAVKSTVSSRDASLVRFAAQAYSNILKQVGSAASTPKVDVMVMRHHSFA